MGARRRDTQSLVPQPRGGDWPCAIDVTVLRAVVRDGPDATVASIRWAAQGIAPPEGGRAHARSPAGCIVPLPPMTPKPFARQLRRVRKVCLSLPGATEKLSHGEPTFFVHKRVFAGFSNNHHGDGHVAVVLPASPGLQEALIEEAPHAYYRPPYVGAAGWVGIELDRVSDETLESHIRRAWQLIVNKTGKR